MNNIFKKSIAFWVILVMILNSLTVISFGLEADESVTANWTPLAATYSSDIGKIIAPSGQGYEIRTTGFEFKENADGGVKIVTPDYDTIKGTCSTSVITSKATTVLDNLSVVINPDEFDSMIDSNKIGNTIGILWTEAQINEIAGFDSTSKSFKTGIFSSAVARGAGLRALIPTPEYSAERTPASDPGVAGLTNGKALYIAVSCDKEAENSKPVATSVSIVYYDGYYINGDGNTGYRWIFTARNHDDTTNSDATRISKAYQSIDLTKGLSVNIRADETLGFIVNINGLDYYKGEDVTYFPDARTDGYGYYLNDYTDAEVEAEDEIYTTSMTYAKDDIDLSGLVGDNGDELKGYLTIGAVSINDREIEGHNCNYTVSYINGVPAAKWAGEALAEDHVCNMEHIATNDPTCILSGGDVYMCAVCGAYELKNEKAPLGHTPDPRGWLRLEEPRCNDPGTYALLCGECGVYIEAEAIPSIPHTFNTEWTVVTKEASCGQPEIRTNFCTACETEITEQISTIPHTYQWTVTEPATCGSAGTEAEVCTICGALGENTRELPIDPETHAGNWKPVFENDQWNGKEAVVCIYCGVDAERTTDVKDYVKHFTDVNKDAWYVSGVAYCVQRGYVSGVTPTTFCPDNNLTRAQFVTLLANIDGVNLNAYANTASGFSDVTSTQWFHKAVTWAAVNGYAKGVGGDKFDPDANVTRAQLARFFYVYSERKGFDISNTTELNGFSDANNVPGWAVTEIKWAVAEGLINGMNGAINGDGNASRAQAARMLMKYTNLD